VEPYFKVGGTAPYYVVVNKMHDEGAFLFYGEIRSPDTTDPFNFVCSI
jgi:hypothetical protein